MEEVEGLARGVIRLDKALEEYGGVRRRVEISTMRGVPVADGYHDMAIREGEGVVVFPRIKRPAFFLAALLNRKLSKTKSIDAGC